MITYLLIGFFSAISLGGLIMNSTFNTHNQRIKHMLRYELETLNKDLEENKDGKDVKDEVKKIYELSKLLIY